MAIMKGQQYEAAFKTKVALEAVGGEKTVAQIVSECVCHSNHVRKWKDRLLCLLPELFSYRRKKREEERDELEAELFRQIGQLRIVNELQKNNFSSYSRGGEAADGGRSRGETSKCAE
jgi:putative transposase